MEKLGKAGFGPESGGMSPVVSEISKITKIYHGNNHLARCRGELEEGAEDVE